MMIDSNGLSFRDLNEKIREAARNHSEILVRNVMGQRYIGCGISNSVKIILQGIPGNDLASFMNGPTIIVEGNAQDGVGNTMNAGKIIIKGNAGDILGHSMRGGRIYVRGSVGYRTGIHIKSYKDQFPVIVIGGAAGDYLGEYMAGGMIIVLGIQNGSKKNEEVVGRYMGTGMHGGSLFVAGEISGYKISREISCQEIPDEEKCFLADVLNDYFSEMEIRNEGMEDIIERLGKYSAVTSRPYGKLYAY
jgi:glutamate synthase domain-containing protein 3